MYRYQVKKSIASLILVTFILNICSPVMGMQPQRPTNSKLSLLFPTLGLIGTGVSWLVLKRYQAKNDKVFKETKQQLPKELQNLIGQYALPQKSKNNLWAVIKLLPVVLHVPKITFNSALEHALKMLQEKRSALENSQELSDLRNHLESHNKQLHNENVIALHATLITSGDVPNAAGNVQHIDLLQRQQLNPNNLLIKNKTNLRTILGQPLLPGQVVLVSYSDGDLKIELTRADKQTLKNLSESQRKFLDSLYSTERVIDNGLPTVYFNSSEYWKFCRLFDRTNKDCLKTFYNIVYNENVVRERTALLIEGFGIAFTCLMFARLFNLDSYYKMENRNWDLNFENFILRCHLRDHNIPLPKGISPTSSIKIGNVTITEP